MNLTESIIQVLDPPDGEFIDRIQIIERLKVLDNSITGTVTTKISQRLNALMELDMVDFKYADRWSKRLWRKTDRGVVEAEYHQRYEKVLATFSTPDN